MVPTNMNPLEQIVARLFFFNNKKNNFQIFLLKSEMIRTLILIPNIILYVHLYTSN